MKQKERPSIRYSIWDPSGNITALVEMESLMAMAEIGTTPAEINTLKPSAEMESTLAESETQLADGEQEVADELRKGMAPLVSNETQLPLAEIAAQIMKKHPEVEQVGFVRDITPPEEGIRAELFMAGGEFCGNAAMCAAAWYAERNRNADAPEQELYLKVSGAEEAVKVHLQEEEEGVYSGSVRMPDAPEQELYLKVSGAEEAVKVHLQKEEEGVYSGSVRMPAATGITYVRLQYGEVQGTLPLVRMQGISHLIIEEDSAFFRFLKERERAEAMVRDQAEKRGLEGLGLMFLKKQGTTPCAKKQSAECSLTPPVRKQGTEYSLTLPVQRQEAKDSLVSCVEQQEAEYSLTPRANRQETEYSLTPLVYIRTAGTLFWENSCGSGSSACGMYLAEKENQPVDLKLAQPGGVLRVKGDLQTGIRLSGRVTKG